MGRITEQEFLESLTSYGVQVCERLTAMQKSKDWLADKMGVTTATLRNKLKGNTFSISEKAYIKELLK